MIPAEHIVELSYMAELLRFLVSGVAFKPDFRYVTRNTDDDTVWGHVAEVDNYTHEQQY